MIVPGERDRLLASGWEVTDEATLGEVSHILAGAGVAVKNGDAAEVAAWACSCAGAGVKRAVHARARAPSSVSRPRDPAARE